MSDIDKVPEKGGMKELVEVESPPPYSSTSAISKKAGDDVKIQMIAERDDNTTENAALPPSREVQRIRKMFDGLGWYAGDEKHCPLTCGIVPARPAALVLLLIYIVFLLALIVRLQEPDVPPEMCGFLLTATMNAFFMPLFFVGFWRKSFFLMYPSICYQCGQTAAVSLATAAIVCVPVLNIVWCFIAGAGDPFGMFTEKWAVKVAVCAALAAFAHFLLAVFVRAALASLDSVSRRRES